MSQQAGTCFLGWQFHRATCASRKRAEQSEAWQEEKETYRQRAGNRICWPCLRCLHRQQGREVSRGSVCGNPPPLLPQAPAVCKAAGRRQACCVAEYLPSRPSKGGECSGLLPRIPVASAAPLIHPHPTPRASGTPRRQAGRRFWLSEASVEPFACCSFPRKSHHSASPAEVGTLQCGAL